MSYSHCYHITAGSLVHECIRVNAFDCCCRSSVLRTSPYPSHSPQLPKTTPIKTVAGCPPCGERSGAPIRNTGWHVANRRTKGENRGRLAKRSLSGRRGSLGESGARPTKNEEVREHGEGHPEVPTGSDAHGRRAAGFLRGRAWFYDRCLMADGRPDATARRLGQRQRRHHQHHRG